MMSDQCANYYGCIGCPNIETCEAFTEADEEGEERDE